VIVTGPASLVSEGPPVVTLPVSGGYQPRVRHS